MKTNYEELRDAYVTAALWSSTDESDTPLDANYGSDDLSDDTRDYLHAIARVFYGRYRAFIDARESANPNSEYSIWARAGHDLWFTQNGHGVGFWARETLWGPYADMFTRGARGLSEIDLYISDDGKVCA